MFLGLNKHSAFKQELANRTGLSSFLRLPLSNEGIEVPQDFKEALEAVLKATPKRGLIPFEDPTLLKLIEVVKKNDKAFS